MRAKSSRKRKDGTYDLSGYATSDYKNSKVYRIWDAMITRCAGRTRHAPHLYEGVSVCEDWKIFSNFKDWWDKQPHNYLYLDKDILKEGNKIYCPEFCRFVPAYINSLIPGGRGGAVYRKVGKNRANWNYTKPYYATITIFGKTVSTGYHATELEALSAYKAYKAFYIMEVIDKYSKEIEYDVSVGEALKKRAYNLLAEADPN